MGPKICQVKFPWTCPKLSDGPLVTNVFSPKGDVYACIDYCNGLHVYGFDRCAGEFYGGEVMSFEEGTYLRGSVAISPNGRYVYAATGYYLYQYDLQAFPIASSKVEIAKCTCIPSPLLGAGFYCLQLAPDNKIYMGSLNNVDVLHIIHQPDEKGIDCQFQEAGFKLPTLNDFSVPNNPFYRLHESTGSPCDSLTLVMPPIPKDCNGNIVIKPNPATDFTNLSVVDCRATRVEVFNTIGQLLYQKELDLKAGENFELDVHDFPPGAYSIRVQYSLGNLAVAKLVVCRN